MNKYKNTSFSIVLPLIISFSIVLGIIIAKVLDNGHTSQSIIITPPKNKLNMVVDYVANEYIDKVDRDYLIEMAIPKFLETLDPHTVYIPADEARAVEEELQGEFSGIGIQFYIFRDTVLVVNVIPGGPSEKYKLKDGDRIIRVNDSLIAGIGITNNEVMSLLKGPSGTNVKLTIKRKNEDNLLEYNIIRGSIPLRSIDAVSYTHLTLPTKRIV